MGSVSAELGIHRSDVSHIHCTDHTLNLLSEYMQSHKVDEDPQHLKLDKPDTRLKMI